MQTRAALSLGRAVQTRGQLLPVPTTGQENKTHLRRPAAWSGWSCRRRPVGLGLSGRRDEPSSRLMMLWWLDKIKSPKHTHTHTALARRISGARRSAFDKASAQTNKGRRGRWNNKKKEAEGLPVVVDLPRCLFFFALYDTLSIGTAAASQVLSVLVCVCARALTAEQAGQQRTGQIVLQTYFAAQERALRFAVPPRPPPPCSSPKKTQSKFPRAVSARQLAARLLVCSHTQFESGSGKGARHSCSLPRLCRPRSPSSIVRTLKQ